MKILFVSAAHSPDMSGGFLWHGLQEACGVENVADATNGNSLRGVAGGKWANDRPIRYFPTHRAPFDNEDDFDLLVVTSTFLRDHDWNWLHRIADRHLRDSNFTDRTKVVFFETLDGAADITALDFPFDAVFRREIDPAIQYPYKHKPLPLLCAIPEEWFDDPVYGWTDDKPYDVFNVSNAVSTGHPARWSSLSPTFCTSKRTKSIAGDGVLQPNTLYLQLARKFKLIVEGPGGGQASDNGHMWESISLGAIPIFVDQACRPRWPWFTGDHCFWCDEPNQLPTIIDLALASDLDARRLRLKEHVLRWHTTKKRAEQFLEMIEKDAWRGAPGPWQW